MREALNRVDGDPVALGGREDALGKQILAAGVARDRLDIHADRVASVRARQRGGKPLAMADADC